MTQATQARQTNASEPKEVRVLYRYIGEAHVLTSPDLLGLYLSSKDPEKVYNLTARVVSDLVKAKWDVDNTYELDTPLEKFLDAIDPKSELDICNLLTRPAIIARHVPMAA